MINSQAITTDPKIDTRTRNPRQLAERIVRMDMEIRDRERTLNAGEASRFAANALSRIRAQRVNFSDALYAAHGFDRAAEILHEVRMDLDAEYRRDR